MPTALVTGASGGVGREITEQLLDAGWSVYAQYCTHAPSAKDNHATWFPLDFDGVSPDLSAVPEITTLDALIHCAGYCELSSVAEATPEQWEASFNINLHGPVALTNHLLDALRRSRGWLVYLNSGAGLRVKPDWTTYASSKFAARAWCDGLRAEEPDLRVVSVHPGRIDTPMQRAIVASEGGTYTPERYLSPETVARSVMQLIHTPADAHPTELVLRPSREGGSLG